MTLLETQLEREDTWGKFERNIFQFSDVLTVSDC